MAGIKIKRLKGTILLESMIAMIIIMLCFGIALMIFNNVTGSKNSIRVLARARINTESVKAKAGKQYIDEDIPFDEFTIRKTIQPTGNGIYRLHFSAVTPDHKILAESDELIYP